MTRTTIAPTKSSVTMISPIPADVRYRLDPKRIIAAPMRIARGPLQHAWLSRWAIWWRGGGDPAFILLCTALCASHTQPERSHGQDGAGVGDVRKIKLSPNATGE